MKQLVAMCPEGNLGVVIEVNQYAPYFDQHSVLKVKDFSVTWFKLQFVTSCGMVLWIDIGERLFDDTEILGEL